MTLSGFVAYVKQAWKNKPDVSTPLSAERLLHMEDGIKMNSDAIEAIAAAVVSQITNDPDKIASMAALYAVNQAVTNLNSNSNNSITSDYFDFSVCQKGAVKCIYDRGYALQTKKAMSANTTYELYILPNDVTKPIIRIDKYVVLRDGIAAQLLIETNGKISITPMVDIPANTYIRLCEVYL